jgi:PEP-CTERM motif
MKTTLKILLASSAMAMATSASAAVVVLDFTGVATTNNVTAVGGFYNGGTSGDGNTGTNYGAAFSNNALAINAYNGCCEPGTPSKGILFFTSGGAVTIDYAAGFDTGFSFVYSSNTNAFIRVYDGLGATGNVLATLNLTQQANTGCAPGSTGFYCNWTAIGVSFSGIAKSIDFGGGANFVAYDDITFGSATPGAVPEPATWAMMIGGFGMVGGAMRYRRRKTAVSFG